MALRCRAHAGSGCCPMAPVSWLLTGHPAPALCHAMGSFRIGACWVGDAHSVGLLGSRCVAVSLEVARSHCQNRVEAWEQPQLVPLPQGRAGSRCAIGDSTRAGEEE